MGSTGETPVPVGDSPTGTSGASAPRAGAGLQNDALSHSAGLVAQRHGQVARATQKRISGHALRKIPAVAQIRPSRGKIWLRAREDLLVSRFPAAFPLTLVLFLREHRIPHCDGSKRSGLARARRAILPLLGERAGVRGKKRFANQRACEPPMKSMSEGKQSSTPGKATSP